MYLADVFTVPSNIAGIPTIAVPSGTVVREGVDLPIGIQDFFLHIVAKMFCLNLVRSLVLSSLDNLQTS